MFDIPAVASAAAKWMDARAHLLRALSREPTENEIRRFLGYPEKVGEVILEYDGVLRFGGATSAPLGGTPFRLCIEKMLDGRIRIVLTDSSYLKAAGSGADA